MTVHASAQSVLAVAADRQRRHRFFLRAGSVMTIALVLTLAVYGLDYYTLDATQRALSPKHTVLRPSGTVGLRLGILGTLLFLGLYLYPVRKRWAWLAKQGNSKHWLDFHVLLGLTAPFVIAFHSSFKFRGLAGMAFWIMVSVALSGVVGRYLYAQIPRSLSAAELSLREMHQLRAQLTLQLAAQKLFSQAALEVLFRLPSIERVQRMPLVWALCSMLVQDLKRPVRVAVLRRRALDWQGKLLTLGGLLHAGNPKVEQAIRTARRQASLSKRILFLSRTHRVFHLWHVVHRPFSYSFAVLAGVHIFIGLLFGLM